MKELMGLMALLLVSTSAGAHEYVLRSYPTTVAACHATATDLGKRFHEATGLNVLDALCMNEEASGFNIRIRYEAKEPVSEVSTDGSHLSVYRPGRYKDAKACEAALPGKSQEFLEATGLTPVFSYCRRDEFSDRIAWIVRIDGFGTPRLEPFLSGYLMFAAPKEVTATEFSSGLRESLQLKGARFSDAIIHSQIGYAEVAVHYYAQKKLRFHLNTYPKTDTFEQCRTQIAEIRNAFRSTVNPASIVYCGYVGVGGAWEINALFVESAALKARNTIESYAKFEECEAARPALVRFYQETLKADVRGSACTRDQGVFRVLLLEP